MPPKAGGGPAAPSSISSNPSLLSTFILLELLIGCSSSTTPPAVSTDTAIGPTTDSGSAVLECRSYGDLPIDNEPLALCLALQQGLTSTRNDEYFHEVEPQGSPGIWYVYSVLLDECDEPGHVSGEFVSLSIVSGTRQTFGSWSATTVRRSGPLGRTSLPGRTFPAFFDPSRSNAVNHVLSGLTRARGRVIWWCEQHTHSRGGRGSRRRGRMEATGDPRRCRGSRPGADPGAGASGGVPVVCA